MVSTPPNIWTKYQFQDSETRNVPRMPQLSHFRVFLHRECSMWLKHVFLLPTKSRVTSVTGKLQSQKVMSSSRYVLSLLQTYRDTRPRGSPRTALCTRRTFCPQSRVDRNTDH